MKNLSPYVPVGRLAAALLLSLAGAAAASAAEPAPCLIEPRQLIKLATPVPGVLEDVLVDRGDRVTKGMLVARLESAVEAADVAAADVRAGDESAVREKLARLEFAQSKHERLEKLRGSTQYVSSTASEEASADAKQAEAELQSATTALRLARIDLSHASAKLGQRTIRSPIDGVVTERPLGPGEYAYDQAHVLTVAQLDPLNVEAFLPISLYGSVAQGAKAVVRPEAPVGGEHEAVVVVIDKVLDSRSGTFGVRLRLPNPGGALPAGIRCTVTFEEQAAALN
jgi:RND family efflux transporter MFP subunit